MGGNIADHFAARCAETPDRVAISDGDRTMTYGELDRESERWAATLRTFGAGPGVLVGLCAERSLELVVLLVGILRAGAAYVPLDPHYPRARLEFVVADSGCGIVVGQPAFGELFAGTDIRFVTDPLAGGTVAARQSAGPDDPAYVIYTSGSSGQPKGVLVSQRNVLRLFETTMEDFAFSPDDVWTLFHSFAFDFSVWEIWGALLFGGRLVVVPYLTSRSPEDFWRLLREERVTVLNQTPSAFRQLSEAASTDSFAGHTLRLVIFGGERLDPATLAAWFAHHGDRSPRLVNMYGITETTVHVTSRTMSAADLTHKGSPIGRPLGDLRVHLLDPELRTVATGEKGEICVGGPGVTLGYLGRPELTEAKFVPDPFGGEGERIYRSGDLASYDENGELLYHGRIDAQVQLRGFRVELGEIEHALTGVPGVGQAAVVLRESGDHAELVAFVSGDGLTATELRTAMVAKLPVHLVPQVFVTVAALPMTGNGKVDRTALSTIDVRKRPTELPFSPPVGETEQVVAEVWSDVLGVRPIGRHDSFVDLGGDSLQAVRVLGRLRSVYGTCPTLGDFFDARTPVALATLLSTVKRATPAKPVRTAAHRSPSANQARLLFLTELSQGASAAYNIPAVVRIRGGLDRSRLALAFDALVDRHEALRTGFSLDRHGHTVSIVATQPGILRLTTRTNERDAAKRAAEIAAEPFDTKRPPLIRAELIAMSDDDHVLAVVVSHLVSDGLSMDLLSRELGEFYEDLGREAEPTQTFPNFVAWQRGTDASRSLAYWKSNLDGVPTVLRLPVSEPRPSIAAFRGHRISRFVPAELRQAVAAVARSEQSTPYAVLLAAYGAEMARLAGGYPDVIIGSPAAGRPDADFDDVVGFFANILPLRLRPHPESTFREAVRAAHRTALDAVDHQYAPFEQIVAGIVGPGQDLSRQPLIQVVFAYQGSHRFEPQLNGLRTRTMAIDPGTSRFDFLLDVSETPEGTTFTAEYDAALFNESAANAMLDGYLRALRTAVVDPGAQLRSLGEPSRRPVQRSEPVRVVTSERQPAEHSDAERILADVWAEALQISTVGPEDDFFALGGDSMSALKVIGTARSRGISITVAQLFQTPTITALAKVIGPGKQEVLGAQKDLLSPEDRAALTEEIEDAYPVAALQMGIIFHCEMDDDPTLYHDLVSVRIRGTFDAEALRHALSTLAARHEILRTSFDLGTFSRPLQLVHRAVEVPLRVAPVSDVEPREAVRRWWREEWSHGFDLETAPLWRCHVLLYDDGTFQLSLTAHHSILDGWSFASLMTELLLRYEQGDAIPVGRPKVRYHEFIQRELAEIDSPEARNHWISRSDPAQPLSPQSSTLAPAAPRLDPDAVITVPASVAERAKNTARMLGTPTKCVYFAAYLGAIQHILDVDEVATGVVVHGRPESLGADETLGLFLNSLPVRVRPASLSDAELIRTVAAIEREDLEFRRFPLAEIQRRHAAPLFHARFNFADFHVLDKLAGLEKVDLVDWWSCDRNEIPISVEVARSSTDPGFEISVRIDETVLSDEAAAVIARRMYERLVEIIDGVERTNR